jgi:uncharacterized integral membrane protein
MTFEREPRRDHPGRDEEKVDHAPPAPERPRTWILPLGFFVAVAAVVMILVLSNTDSHELGFAGFRWEAPLWIILTVTFVAGAVLTRLVGWIWTSIRKRGRKRLAEYDRARREAPGN